MDELAIVEAHGADRLLIASTRRRSSALIAVTGRLLTNDAASLGLLVRDGGLLVTVPTAEESAPVAPRAMAVIVAVIAMIVMMMMIAMVVVVVMMVAMIVLGRVLMVVVVDTLRRAAALRVLAEHQ